MNVRIIPYCCAILAGMSFTPLLASDSDLIEFKSQPRQTMKDSDSEGSEEFEEYVPADLSKYRPYIFQTQKDDYLKIQNARLYSIDTLFSLLNTDRGNPQGAIKNFKLSMNFLKAQRTLQPDLQDDADIEKVAIPAYEDFAVYKTALLNRLNAAQKELPPSMWNYLMPLRTMCNEVDVSTKTEQKLELFNYAFDLIIQEMEKAQ